LTADLLQQLQGALGAGYRFDRELGGGGMSRVFLAEETGLARRVVVKVLPPELGAGVNVDRFRRETQLAASLQHPHIVPLLTAGAAGDLLYYTMPFIEGESLRARLAREHELPVRDALRILRDVADALAYAHGRGVVHRDIKPDNVLLSGGHALVADFGIAKALSQAAGSSGLTSVGVAIGTPTYMAPEQAAGDPAVDHRADIYAFGAMAYEMLGGRPPFAGLSPHQTLAAHVTETIEPVTKHRPQLPRPLAELVMWCLEKNPADRPQTAAELVPALEGLTTPSGHTASVRFGKRAPLPWRRIAIAATAVLAAGGAWLAFGSRRPEVLDPNRIAVAPFDVLDPALTLWREGLVDVLSRSLDGAGPLRTVSPTVVVKRWGGRADAASAQALGLTTGARTVVFGQLLGAGHDSVRLQATVLDVVSGTHDEIELRDAPDRVDRLADSLTVAVLRTLGRTRAIGAVRGTPLGSKSLPALKAFLQGEQFLRRSQYDSALTYHQQAIALDSTFVLALSHASLASGWQHSGSDSLTVAYALAAGRLNHGLAPRESLIVQADSLSAVASAGRSRPEERGGLSANA
jgi:serine/threonine-protein kinase